MDLLKTHTGDPVKPVGTNADARPSVYNPTTTSTSSAYVSNPGMTVSKQKGNIAYYGDINSELSPEAETKIRNSKFGKTYLSGEGSITEQYKTYTTKVNNFLNDNPEKALVAIKEMAAKNDNFKTKLRNEDGSWKSNEQMLEMTGR